MSPLSKCEQLQQKGPPLTLVHDEKTIAPSLLKEIHQLSNEALFGGTIVNSDMGQSARAGLILAAGGWDEAHRIVQALDIPEAQYWHGIVHRREPDSSNAKYWFRQLKHHVIMDQLSKFATQNFGSEVQAVQQLTETGRWDPFKFIDLCMACHKGSQKGLLPVLLGIQLMEFTSLLNYCRHLALGRHLKTP